MNVKEYISSGNLEAYLLGILSVSEREELEEMLKRHEEINAEFNSIEETLNKYINEYSVKPPEKIRDKILSSVWRTEEHVKEKSISPLLHADNRNTMYVRWAIAASLLMLVSIGLNIYLSMKIQEGSSLTLQLQNKQRMDSISEMELKKYGTSLSDSIRVLGKDFRQESADLAVLKDPMYKLIPLKGMEGAPNAKALVCWRPDDKKLFIEVHNLPTPPDTMQYELWAVIKGKPVNVGLIENGKGLHKMNDTPKPSAFAVTLEKKGGSDVPHGAFYLMGSI